jgi:predicted nucleic acid-binding protein
MADAYLAGFASAAKLRLVTFDKGFRKRPVECLVLSAE